MTKQLESGQPWASRSANITRIGSGMTPIGASRRDEDDRGDRPDQAQPQPRQPSMMTNLLVTAAVALISGVIGAMGYSQFFGPKPGESSSSQSKTEAASNRESSSKQQVGRETQHRVGHGVEHPDVDLVRDPGIQLSPGGGRAEAADQEPQSKDRSARRAG